MAKTINEGMDVLQNVGLDGLPTAGKLWIVGFEEVEAEIAASDTLATLTQAMATELSATGLSCVDQVIDLGGPHSFPEITGTLGCIGILTDDPDSAGAKVIAVEDVPGGPLDLSVSGPYTASALSVQIAGA